MLRRHKYNIVKKKLIFSWPPYYFKMDSLCDVKRKALKTILLVLCMDEEDENQPPAKKARNAWVSPWVNKRKTDGCYQKLLKELQSVDEQKHLYRNFFRMDEGNFNELLNLVAPIIAKEDTVMRKSIPAAERLALTLRFLATGDSFRSLAFLFRVPHNTISTIVPEVCNALYTVLKGIYMKV